MLRKLAISTAFGLGFVLLLSSGARAGTPFGGDDTGFLPPGGSKSPLGKCEAAASKAASKMVACIIKCHDSRASGKLLTAADEEVCENLGTKGTNGCVAKYDAAATKAIGKGGCPTCLDTNAEWAAASSLATAVLDGSNALAYCASPSGAFLDGSTSF